MKKYFYAVKKGKNPGVYLTWEECNNQVKGYKNAIFKKFSTEKEAYNFLEDKEEILEINEDIAIAYVDGSYNPKTKEFGYGIIFIDGSERVLKKEKFDTKGVSDQRNVAGEVYGSVFAIKEAIERNKKEIIIYHDYAGISAWAKGEWKTNIELTQRYKLFIDGVKEKIKINFVKVKAHSNDELNDLADKLAKEAVGI